MSFDIGKGLAGFAGGALSGYKSVMEMKMREDSDTKREEAIMNRQSNLEKLRYEREAPDRLKAQQQTDLKISNDAKYNEGSLANQRLNIDNNAREAAAAGARAERALALQAENNRLSRAMDERKLELSDPVKQQQRMDEYQSSAVNKFAESIGEKVIKDGGSEQAAAEASAMIQGLGVKSQKEFREATANPDFLKTVNNVREKSSEEIGKQILEWNQSEDGQKQKIKAATQMGWKGSGSPDNYLRKQYIADAVSSLSPEAPTSSKGTVNPGSVVLDDSKASKLASDLSAGSQGATDMYRALGAPEKAKVDKFLKTNKKPQGPTVYNPAALSKAQEDYSNRY